MPKLMINYAKIGINITNIAESTSSQPMDSGKTVIRELLAKLLPHLGFTVIVNREGDSDNDWLEVRRDPNSTFNGQDIYRTIESLERSVEPTTYDLQGEVGHHNRSPPDAKLPLYEAADELKELFAEVERTINDTLPKVECSVKIKDGLHLSYCRYGGQFRITIMFELGHELSKPIAVEEVKLSIRCEAIEYLPALIEKIREAGQEQLTQCEAAKEKLQAIKERLAVK